MTVQLHFMLAKRSPYFFILDDSLPRYVQLLPSVEREYNPVPLSERFSLSAPLALVI